MAKVRFLIAVVASIFFTALTCFGQDVAVKTNLINDIALSPNIGGEIRLAPKWTVDLMAEGNYWTIGGRKWKHWFVQPEARYWLCQSFEGHFLGLHAIAGQYNFGNLRLPDFLGNDLSELRNKRYQGRGYGAGIGYGYAWPIARHWNIEAELGIGWIRTKFDVFPCDECGTKLESGKVHNYFGPTKAAVNLVYIF